MLKLTLLIYIISAVVEPSSDPAASILDLLASASGPALMAVIIFGAINEWWVPGRTHRRIVGERDALLSLALGGQGLGHRALDAATIIAASASSASAQKGDVDK